MTKFLVDTVENLPIGSLKNITAGGKEILVVNVNGNYYAINNICNHAGAELHEGIVLMIKNWSVLGILLNGMLKKEI